MFYCLRCADEKGWPETLSKSIGKCEICDKHAACNNLPLSSDSRPVVKVQKDYYWYCPECQERNEEVIVPDTSDLTCQTCGANFKNGG